MSRFARAALVSSMLAGAAGCSLVFGVDDLVPSGGGGCDAGACADDALTLPDVRIIGNGDGGTCACFGAPPSGWQGPVALASASAMAPPCGGDYSVDVLHASADLDAPAAECGCTCDTSGVTCPSSFSVNLFSDATCTSSSKCDAVTVSVGACIDVQKNCFNVNGIGPAPSVGGSCSPKPTSNVPAWSWKSDVRACELAVPPTRGGCAAEEVCAPLPSAAMGLRPCVFQSGDVACPAGPYSVKRVLYGGAVDSRACSTCGCAAPTGSCTATIGSNCPPTTTATLGSCTALGDPNRIVLTAAPTPTGAMCAATGGQATGAVTPNSPTTVCCLP